ncbi:hypothetical protein JOF46_001771 [Paeniglutamicibacter psychrophenolicus]|uniref:ClpX-type ZB domain-containing protein n=2 Tax=Paeniglutamicibacter psychrophenolicus TaxID=257454 RepID=A0ABS4WCC0_9MICC|nr:hypothetical protein [Paeniglutamicibacter psychrophenolicus]
MSDTGAMKEPADRMADTGQCSFCGRSREACGKLAYGPGVAICSDCTENCASLHAGGVASEPWLEMTREQVLELLPRISAVAAQVEQRLAAWVGVARDKGASWARVGEALAMTRQSAWERFKQPGNHRTKGHEPPMADTQG